MRNKLNIKRYYLLLAAIIVMMVVCYQLAFKRTIAAWQLNKQLKRDAEQQSNLNYQPGYLERKNRNLDRIIEKYKGDSTSFRSKLIDEASLLAEKQNVKLVDLPVDDPAYHNERYIVQRLDFEGDYSNLLKLTDLLAKQSDIGRLRSLMFRRPARPIDNGKSSLILTVYMELVK